MTTMMCHTVKVTEQNATPSGVNAFVTEASTLCIPPGEVRTQIPTTLGNGQNFNLMDCNESKAVYRQGEGCLRLTVFND